MLKAVMIASNAMYPTETIENKLNDYLKSNPSHRIISTSYAAVGALEKVLLIVDIPGERSDRKPNNMNAPKKDVK